MGNQVSLEEEDSQTQDDGKYIFVHNINEESVINNVDSLICYIDTSWSVEDTFNRTLIDKGGNQFISTRQALQDRYRGNCVVGDVFPCNAGLLPCKKVFFCVVPSPEDNSGASDNSIVDILAAIFETVMLAPVMAGLKSLALPLGAGDLCPHPSEAIPMVYYKLLTLNSSVRNIHLVTFDSGIVDMMEKVLAECHESVPTRIKELEYQTESGHIGTGTKPPEFKNNLLEGNKDTMLQNLETDKETFEVVNVESDEEDEYSACGEEQVCNRFVEDNPAVTQEKQSKSEKLTEFSQQNMRDIILNSSDSVEQISEKTLTSPHSDSSERFIASSIKKQNFKPQNESEVVDEEFSDDDDDDSSNNSDVNDYDFDKVKEGHFLNPWGTNCKKDSLIRKKVQFSGKVTERHIGGDEFMRSISFSSDENDTLDFDNNFSGTKVTRDVRDETPVQPLEECFVCPICRQEKSMDFQKKLEKCGHIFCRDCIKQHFAVKKNCPICNTFYGLNIGNQPEVGLMSFRIEPESLPGYDGSETIVIEYDIPDGIQTEEHPNPGQQYKGLHRIAYLPRTGDGERVHKLLQKAFEQRLTFTVGKSMTTGKENVVTWNDIHHKTNKRGGPQRFGYPDPSYLVRVYGELKQKGITEN